MTPLLSIISDASLRYPAELDDFSPDQAFPEYKLGHISSRPNPVYAAVRQVLVQAGLDSGRLGTPEWNPLGSFIAPASRVFVLCNFVYHRRPGESVENFQAKCTHGSVLRAVLDYVLIACGQGARVRFGNAPLQSCDWAAVLRDTGAGRVLDFYTQRGLDVAAIDLRRFVAQRNRLGAVTESESRDCADAVEIDIGSDSLLAQFDSQRPRFRVTDYDPARTENYQNAAHHVYAVNREILDSDVIFSVPKLKTHEKVGITCNLKGMVGTIALKDSLAHHRFGSPVQGGDEYPTDSRWLRMLSRFHDDTYRQNGSGGAMANLRKILDVNLRRIARHSGQILAGAWHGNDTAWRMTLDINRIVTYADASGRLQDRPQRRHLGMVDGIVGGEGNGPLDPTAVMCGALVFSNDLVLGDRACCALMGLDTDSLALVREASRLASLPLASSTAETVAVVNGTRMPSTRLADLCLRPFRCPAGWVGHVEARNAR